MKKSISLALLCTLVVAVALPAAAQEGMPPMGRPAEMDKVSFMLGEWDVVMEMRMGPEAPWMKSEGTSLTTAILDGCAQRSDFSADVMGMPMKGIETLAYNRETGEFESTWIDNMGASLSIMRGNLEDGAMVMKGSSMRMGQKVHMKTVGEKVDENTLNWRMDESVDGGETWYASMKMVYTRAE